MYLDKETRKKLLQESMDMKEVKTKLDLILETLMVSKQLKEAATDDIEVEVDGEVVVDTDNDSVADTLESDVAVDQTSDMSEEPVDKDTPADEFGPAHGFSSMIIAAIQDEYKTIEMYNDMIATANQEGFEDIVRIVKHINEEELIHVGMLQQLLKQIDADAEVIDNGVQEADDLLSGKEVEE